MDTECSKIRYFIRTDTKTGKEKVPDKQGQNQKAVSNTDIVLSVSNGVSEFNKNYRGIPYGDILVIFAHKQREFTAKNENEIEKERYRTLTEMFKLDTIVQSITGKDPGFRHKISASKTRSTGNPRGEWTAEKEAEMERKLIKAGLLKT